MITHLNVYSHFNLLAGIASVTELAERAAADGMTALALTDRNVLYGAVKFTEACRAQNIRPIIGMTLTLAAPESAVDQQPSDLILLARNPSGYRSLCHLSSLLQADPDRADHLKDGLPWSQFGRFQAGLIAIEPGRNGRLQRLLQADHKAEAGRYVARLGGFFPDHAYLGLELSTDEMASDIAPQLQRLGQRFGIPLVALQPVFCLEPEQRDLFPLLAAIDNNCLVDQVPARQLPDNGNPAIDLHWYSAEMMRQTFAAFPDALDQIGNIVAQIEPSMPDGKPIWPILDLPAGQSAETSIRQQATAGLQHHYPDAPPTTLSRLEYELETITTFGFAPLFLIVADIVRYAQQAAVPVSTRGSVANSLVAYCLGITTVDPIEHDLLFERFLNPARRNLPDIDLDFCSRRRDIVLEYVRDKYGADHVALVATINTLKKKSAVRETAKALGYSKAQTDPLIAKLPSSWHPDPRRRDTRQLHELVSEYTDPADRRVIAAAGRIAGQPHHLSVHPGGMVITPEPINNFVPTQWTNKGFVITQFPHEDVEKIGLPKLDLLGIRALTVQADSAEMIRAHDDPTFDLTAIDLHDPATQHTLMMGDTIGVFQCESSGARATLRKLKAKTIRDLAIANAFFKPGPATGGMAQNFVRRYRGEEETHYLHPALEPILSSTKGVMIFQEQILRVVREIGGLDWTQANQIRKGMSKFDAKAIHDLEQAFVAGCQQQSADGQPFSAEQAQTLWQQVVAFAGYGFNQGHATAYADVSYHAAFLKTHYPAAFLCARLINGGGYYHPAVYVEEARRLGIAIRAPHINHSQRHFSLTHSDQQATLWMGLSWVRSLRRSSIDAIIAQRPFASLSDLRQRVALQSKEIVHLVQSGALDGLGTNRNSMLQQAQQHAPAGQLSFGFIDVVADESAESSLGESAEKRAQWETRLLGFPISQNPAQGKAQPIAEQPVSNGKSATICGMRLPSWRGGFLLSDGSGIVEVMLPKGNRFQPPKRWSVATVSGFWRVDEVGTSWLEATNISAETHKK